MVPVVKSQLAASLAPATPAPPATGLTAHVTSPPPPHATSNSSLLPRASLAAASSLALAAATHGSSLSSPPLFAAQLLRSNSPVIGAPALPTSGDERAADMLRLSAREERALIALSAVTLAELYTAGANTGEQWAGIDAVDWSLNLRSCREVRASFILLFLRPLWARLTRTV